MKWYTRETNILFVLLIRIFAFLSELPRGYFLCWLICLVKESWSSIKIRWSLLTLNTLMLNTHFLRSSLIYNMSARHERNECDTSNTSATQVRHIRHECDTSATWVWRQWKMLILIMTRVKTYFHTPTFTIWQVKDYKDTNNFILRTIFWKCLIPMQNSFKKCTTKTENFNGKDISKSCTLDCSCTLMPLRVPA